MLHGARVEEAAMGCVAANDGLHSIDKSLPELLDDGLLRRVAVRPSHFHGTCRAAEDNPRKLWL